MADVTGIPLPTASTSGVCGWCRNPIGHATRTLHKCCFPEHRHPDLIDEDSKRCAVICYDEDGQRCPRPRIAHDWCGKHHMRWQRTGHPLGNRTRTAAKTPCSVVEGSEPCGKVSVSSKPQPLCRRHYYRYRRHGDPLKITRRQFVYSGDFEADFWRFVDTQGGNRDACWRWRGTVSVHGYGTFLHAPAHRYAYMLERGQIPETDPMTGAKIVLDHACHNPETCAGGSSCPHRRCVNPWHLEPVPTTVNTSPARSSNGRPVDDQCGIGGCTRPYVVLQPQRMCHGHRLRLIKYGDVFADQPLRNGKRLIPATHCRRGHPITGPDADVYIRTDGSRRCQRCRRIRDGKTAA